MCHEGNHQGGSALEPRAGRPPRRLEGGEPATQSRGIGRLRAGTACAGAPAARSSRKGPAQPCGWKAGGCRPCQALLATRRSLGSVLSAVGSQRRPVGVVTPPFGDSAQLLPGSGRFSVVPKRGDQRGGVCLAGLQEGRTGRGCATGKTSERGAGRTK